MSKMPAIGDVIDEVFAVEAELDSGNFGSVYRVRDLLEHRTLALKVLRPGAHDEDELRKRFEREARLIYSLDHPHVVKVYYYGQTPSGLPYLAMDYLKGTDLRTLLHSNGPLHPALTKRITLETLSALESAHEIGIVHRDLKPANIFLVNDGGKGHVKVLDFGFAKAFDDEDANELTNAQTLVGTPAYMAPELVHKKDVGPQADLYALGLIMAEMLCGKKIVDIENVYDTILFQASHKPIKLPTKVRSSAFSELIQSVVQKDLKRRVGSAAEFSAALRAIEVEGEVAPEPPGQQLDSRSFGRADVNASTVPRGNGMPSIDEVDQALGTQSRAGQVRLRDQPGPSVGLAAHSEPQFDSQQLIPQHARSGATEPVFSMADERPISRQSEGSRHAKEILIGLLVGGVVIGAIMLVLLFGVQ